MTTPTAAPLSAEQLDKLEALARDATPGPWHANSAYADNGEFSGIDICATDGSMLLSEDSGPGTKDSQFIAAANPAAILALIAQARAAGQAKPECTGCDPAEGFCADCRAAEKKARTVPQATAPQPSVGEQVHIEAAAKAIYRLFDGADAHPWVEGGNSNKQDYARRYARAAITQGASSAPAGYERAGWFLREGAAWVATSSDDPRATILYRQATPASASGEGIRGPLTDAQRDECRNLYNNLKHLQSGGYYVADDVIRRAAVYGYTNGYKDFAPSREEAPAAQAVAAAPVTFEAWWSAPHPVTGHPPASTLDEYSARKGGDAAVWQYIFSKAAAPAASVAQAEDAKDAARYRVLRMHVKPGDVNLAMTRRPPPHQTASERIDMLCDLAMSSTQHSAKAGGDK